MPRILLAWIGQTDLDCAAGKRPGAGPTGSVVTARPFDGLVLLSNYGEGASEAYAAWLKRNEGAPPIHIRHEPLGDPTDFAAIHEAEVRAFEFVAEEFEPDADLAIHISPGTPAMQAVWVLLAKTRFPAELIQSSPQAGVRTVSFPFDISAEYVPDLLRRPDAKLQRLSEGLPPDSPEFGAIIRRGAAMERAVARARRVAPHHVPVLIEGESGTGKELFARAIHHASARSAKRFEAVNCGALPRELVESLLFGHEKGAFTGANERRIGFFESASGGTLFLDEVGELPLDAQVKLLRALQERQIQRIGSEKAISVDVRVIAATNRDLRAEVAAGRFREDLYHRLAVGVIGLPPLRERQGDVGLLVDHILEGINRDAASQPGYEQKRLSLGARNLLLRHSWPGNVRELHNILLRLSIWVPGPTIEIDDVRSELQPGAGREPDLLGRPLGEGLDLPVLVGELVSHYLHRALEEAGGNKTRAAGLVGLPSYQTLTNWLNKYRVKQPKRGQRR